MRILTIGSVSYTHLDVYKRQGLARSFAFCCQGESENADVDWKGRFMESREAVVAQFHELGNILEEAAGQITDVTDVTGQMENMMKHALKEHRIRPEKMQMCIRDSFNDGLVHISDIA